MSTGSQRRHLPTGHSEAVTDSPAATIPPSSCVAHRHREQQATFAAQQALCALEAPWHMAVVSGPDTGVVLALPVGRVVIGRGWLLNDPALSRTHCEVEVTTHTVRLTACHAQAQRRRRLGWRHVRPGSQLREGHRLRLAGTILELRRQPVGLQVPAPRQRRSGRWVTALTLASLLAACLGVAAAVWFQRSSGTRLPLGTLTAIPLVTLMGIRVLASAGQGGTRWRSTGRGRRHPQGWDGRRPDPAGMFLGLARRCLQGPSQAVRGTPMTAATDALLPPAAGPPVCAWAGRRSRRWILRLDPGSTAVLQGHSAPAWGLWWVAQVVASGQGTAACLGSTLESGLLISWGAGGGQPSPTAPTGSGTARPQRSRPHRAANQSEGSRAYPWCGVVQPAGAHTLPASTTLLGRVPRRAPGTSPAWQAAVVQLIEWVSSGSWTAAGASVTALGDAPPHHGWRVSSQHDLSESGLPDSVDLVELVGSRGRDEVLRLWAQWDQQIHHEQRIQQDQQDDPVVPTRPATTPQPHLTAVLGVGQSFSRRSRSPVTVEVDLARQGPHALVAGTTGAGKSDLLTAWLLQLSALNPPDCLSLVLVDYKGGAAFGPLERLPHTAGVLTDLDPSLTTRALASLQAEVARRERLLARLGCKDAAHLPPNQRLPAVVIVVDEFATLAHSHPEVLDALVRVAAQGRSLGLHLILATQRPAGAVSPEVRANASLRLCLRVLEETDSRDVLGTGLAAHLSPLPGRLVVADASGRMEVVQAPWCGPEVQVAAQVEAVVAAAHASGAGQEAWRPWAPPLPAVVRRSDLPALEERGRTDCVPLALLDDPDRQRTLAWAWNPGRPLLILSAPGSGRTTTLLSAAYGFHQSIGAPVHLVGTSQDWERARAAVPGQPATTPSLSVLMGTRVSPDDPRRLARLVDLACSGALAGSLLVVDDASGLIDAVDRSRGPGEGLLMWEALCRQAPTVGTALAVGAGLASSSARWASAVSTRVVLGARDPAQAALAGLPRGWLCAAGNGSGVLVEGAGAAYACQMCLPDEDRPAPGDREPARASIRRHARPDPQEGGQGRTRQGPAHSHPGTILQPIALRPNAPGAWAVGGDRASPLPVPIGHVLIVGPAGSGRSTTLRALASCLREADRQPLLLDDVDLATPEQVTAAQRALEQGHQVLASAAATSTAVTYRGLLAQLRERATLVVLWPGLCPVGGLTSVDLRPASDPAYPTWPGRGVMVERGQAVPLQVVYPDEEPSRPTGGL